MRIGILGTRGIPNHYGGFEQITERLSVGLLKKGHQVSVYNSHHHPFQGKDWNGVEIIHCYDPESFLKTAGQFVYDLNCILDARRQHFDVIIFMGYTSSSVWWRLFPARSIIISNMDGLEWKRTKYSQPVRWLLKHAERLAVAHSQFHIADSPAIRAYLASEYGIGAEYISYGADMIQQEDESTLKKHKLIKDEYYLLMARMEPENSIDMILDGFCQTTTGKKFVVIGNTSNRYGRYIHNKYYSDPRVVFTGAVFEQGQIHSLRKNCSMYFHGHSVGGTNPSLLEAMSSHALIAANENVFNRAILGENAFYFSSGTDVQKLINATISTDRSAQMKESNYNKITQQFRWDDIIDKYDAYIKNCYEKMADEKIVYHKGYALK